MNILFVTNNLYPYLNANSEIAYKLASVLKSEYGCDVTILGYSDKARDNTENPFGVDEYEMKAIGLGRRIMARHENRILKLARLLCHPKAFVFILRPEKDTRYRLKSQYKKAIKRLCQEQLFDCIVCFKNPNVTLAAAIEANTNVPIIAYELDPWEKIQNQTEKELKEQQYYLEKNCSAIITTKLLYSNYLDRSSRIPIERVFQAEFPNIIQQRESKTDLFTDNAIHCVFTGQLYEDIRNPKYTIELFSKFADDNIVLDVFGNDNGCLKDYTLPDNILFHGEVTSEEAMEYLMASDVVVNIGNTLMYMLPSKLLTYISLGKPILNIIKGEDCPTLLYMKDYPLALSVVETDMVSQETAYRVKAFCKCVRGKKVDFATVHEMFYKATPEYVGGQLYDVIKNILEND